MDKQNKRLPRPNLKAPIPTQDEFDAWTEHPVTVFVATAYQRLAELQREAWLESSWGSGQGDALMLNELRTRADAYMAFLETGLEQYERALPQG